MCEKILFEMSGPHTGVFGRKDLCNSRIYLLTKDAEINVALLAGVYGEMMKWWILCQCCVKTLT